MTRNLLILGCAALLAIGLSFGAFAGSVTDTDGDGVFDTAWIEVAAETVARFDHEFAEAGSHRLEFEIRDGFLGRDRASIAVNVLPE